MVAEPRNQKSGDEIPPEIIAVGKFQTRGQEPTAPCLPSNVKKEGNLAQQQRKLFSGPAGRSLSLVPSIC
jgi:hypothetical protein